MIYGKDVIDMVVKSQLKKMAFYSVLLFCLLSLMKEYL
jgi:hypothetical protein